MKLIDPETNKEYEVVGTDLPNEFKVGEEDYACFIVKPVDSWPKEGDEYWFINADGDVGHIEQNRYGLDENDKFLGIYRTKQEAEYAADRIRSLQKITLVDVSYYGANYVKPQDDPIVSFMIPKKYLKAWRELQDEAR